MSELHHLLTFPQRPITAEYYLADLKKKLADGIPATYTLEQANAFTNNVPEDENGPNTTPLHIMCRNIPEDCNDDELKVVLELMQVLFEYGAGWNFVDFEDKTVGDLLQEHGFGVDHFLYKRVVEAGVMAELLLRKVNETSIEWMDNDDDDDDDDDQGAAGNQQVFLQTELEYTENALVTKDEKDGVMMDWETQIMQLAAKTLTENVNADDDQCVDVLNIGFGMGIIDTFIQEELKQLNRPTKHYICEAHPDVLKKLKQDGWDKKENVVILSGRWQDTLNALLDRGDVFFNGIYYDTFSEHYEDMLDGLYDLVCGLLKPHGIFSFFHGLGADRPLCYEVYTRIVEIDLRSYGLQCQYERIKIDNDKSEDLTKPQQEDRWDGVKRSYFNSDHYYHPKVTFIQ